MRYRLRTLMIVLALGPPVIWGGWLAYEAIAMEVVRAMFPVPVVQPAIPLDDGSWNPSYPAAGEERY
jgi:hypothetical protein